jgi:hypothetical protein
VLRMIPGWLEFFAREGTFALPVFLFAQERQHEALNMYEPGVMD